MSRKPRSIASNFLVLRMNLESRKQHSSTFFPGFLGFQIFSYPRRSALSAVDFSGRSFWRVRRNSCATACFLRRTSRGEFLQLLPLLGIQARRHFHELRARSRSPRPRPSTLTDAFAAQFENLSALRSRRDFQVRFAFQRRHRDFAAERSQWKRNRHLAIKIVFIALKNRVLLDVDDDVKIALRPAANAGLAIAARSAGASHPRCQPESLV